MGDVRLAETLETAFSSWIVCSLGQGGRINGMLFIRSAVTKPDALKGRGRIHQGGGAKGKTLS